MQGAEIVIGAIVFAAVWGYAFKRWGFLTGLTIGWVPAAVAFILSIFAVILLSQL